MVDGAVGGDEGWARVTSIFEKVTDVVWNHVAAFVVGGAAGSVVSVAVGFDELDVVAVADECHGAGLGDGVWTGFQNFVDAAAEDRCSSGSEGFGEGGFEFSVDGVGGFAGERGNDVGHFCAG